MIDIKILDIIYGIMLIIILILLTYAVITDILKPVFITHTTCGNVFATEKTNARDYERARETLKQKKEKIANYQQYPWLINITVTETK